ncbi:hypothetical protein BDV95DRAFT_646380 [Massariosphaeria phaeospora]|uniref:Uncharacterized protein n=1 Tax=Massariosphaeria phaeospora TaxID=100035 RepID=A0A7C8M9P7_9PLEO|nr:hypothetical protein BDV95DRAFT_646380 [Massariosphaeria phaeospora]
MSAVRRHCIIEGRQHPRLPFLFIPQLLSFSASQFRSFPTIPDPLYSCTESGTLMERSLPKQGPVRPERRRRRVREVGEQPIASLVVPSGVRQETLAQPAAAEEKQGQRRPLVERHPPTKTSVSLPKLNSIPSHALDGAQASPALKDTHPARCGCLTGLKMRARGYFVEKKLKQPKDDQFEEARNQIKEDLQEWNEFQARLPELIRPARLSIEQEIAELNRKEMEERKEKTLLHIRSRTRTISTAGKLVKNTQTSVHTMPLDEETQGLWMATQKHPAYRSSLRAPPESEAV